MDLGLYLKFIIYKLGSSYLQRYSTANEHFRYLQQVIPPFMGKRLSDKPTGKRALFASSGWYDAKTEAIYLKALEALGYEPCVLTGYDPYLEKIFNIYGIKKIFYYEDFFKKFSLKKITIEAKSYITGATGKDILEIKKNGINVGKFAASGFMRSTRGSNLDLRDSKQQQLFITELSYSLRAANSIEIILDEIKPDLVFVIDRGYAPVGQLFDACLKRAIPVISRNASHKSGWEILKRYSRPEDGINHPHSLSGESWEYIRKMPWNNNMWQELYNELAKTYGSGDWFAEVGTQFNKKVYSKKELTSLLKLDPKKKTAVIFPHIFWDATFFWGEDLFENYYDWFVNVLKVAARNENLNWVIKIHPANVVKAKRDNYQGEHTELTAVHEILGQIPGHIRIIEPESDINTFSLFDLMDYCLTVRGTIGIEAAAFGITTLTAGTGRYDHFGFTYDFNSKKDYLECVRSLENMPPMTEDIIELARRFAYGIFILRPIHLDLLEHGYNQDEKGSMKYRPLFKDREEFENSKFVQGVGHFVMSGKEDCLNI